tara:strand:+ start:3990 stop:6692 length:2703 start_codon:yes stop_codon:yes gene_type:complete
MDICADLNKIEFGIYSTEEILKLSVCEVNSVKLSGDNSVYDKRMGVLELHETCPTCNQGSKYCVGHFGHIKLNEAVLHPLYYKLILSILKCICYKCSKLLLSRDKLYLNNLLKNNGSQQFYSIVKKMDKIDTCDCCDTLQPKYIFQTTEKQIYMIFKINGEVTRIPMFENEIYKLISNISDDDLKLLGIFSKNFHPKNLIINTLLVLPPVSRPYVLADTVTCDDDLTLQYCEIIKANNQIGNNKTSDFKKQKFIQMLKFRIRSLFDNSGEKQKVSNGRPLKGIKKRLTGKEGIIRNNLMGKRVDKSARSVIGPDPTLKIDEIAIPRNIANILSYPVNVNQHNYDEILQLIKDNKTNFVIRDDNNIRINMKYATTSIENKLKYGDVIMNKENIQFVKKETDIFSFHKGDNIYRDGTYLNNINENFKKNFELKIGDIVERKLQDGDILLLNRQPTLHRGSMIAMRIKIRDAKTIRLNLAVTNSFNADFDGDEMNLFLPNNVESEAELRLLSSVDNFIVNPQSSKANIVIVQDSAVGIYKMTQRTLPELTRRQFFKVVSVIDFDVFPVIQTKMKLMKTKKYTGKLLFSLLLPDDFYLSTENNIDKDEPIVVIERGLLLKGTLKKSNLNEIISKLYLEYDVETSKKFINNVQFIASEFLMITSFTIGIKDCIIENENDIQFMIKKSLMKGKSIEESIKNEKLKEIYTLFSLGGARDVGLSIAKNSLQQDNNFITSVNSGAKGDFFNIAQITGLLGQQNVNGGRILYSLSNFQRSLPHYPINNEHVDDDLKYESKGFIRNCFAKGLSPKEFFLHSITGREGITDTAMKTATSGYIQRRMIKITEDVKVHNDGTVRNLNNNIIQFSYGNNFFNSSHSINKKNDILPFDINRLVTKINHSYETNIKI